MKNLLAYLLTATGVACQHLFSISTDALFYLFDLFRTKNGFDAKFGKETEIGNRWNKGFIYSRHRKLSRRRSFENVLLAGPTGSGKTVRVISKILFSLKNCSIIINDPSKELYELTSGHLSKFFEIKTINFSDSSVSSGYNILSRIKKNNDINKIAHVLVSATLDKGGNSDPFWSLQTKALLTILVKLVLHQPEPYRSMASVLHALKLFSATPKIVDRWIVESGDEKLLLDYKSLVATPEKTLQNIVASAKAALQIFEDEEIAKVTAFDSIDFNQLREKPTVIFLHNSISDMKYVNILNGIFFEQFYGFVLQNIPQKRELDIYVILEEASSLYIPILPTAIANTRKHRVGNLVCVQSPGQLQTFYGEDAKNISANCLTKIFLPGQTNIEVLRDLETYGGKFIHKDKHGTERIRPLITIEEIRLLGKNRSLILSGNKPLILGRTSPYFKSFKYKGFAKIPAIPLTGDIPEENLILIGEPLPEIPNEERSENEDSE